VAQSLGGLHVLLGRERRGYFWLYKVSADRQMPPAGEKVILLVEQVERC